jgi:hypothetical protein
MALSTELPGPLDGVRRPTGVSARDASADGHCHPAGPPWLAAGVPGPGAVPRGEVPSRKPSGGAGTPQPAAAIPPPGTAGDAAGSAPAAPDSLASAAGKVRRRMSVSGSKDEVHGVESPPLEPCCVCCVPHDAAPTPRLELSAAASAAANAPATLAAAAWPLDGCGQHSGAAPAARVMAEGTPRPRERCA